MPAGLRQTDRSRLSMLLNPRGPASQRLSWLLAPDDALPQSASIHNNNNKNDNKAIIAERVTAVVVMVERLDSTYIQGNAETADVYASRK
jgi:hypothetical protein